MRVCVYLGAKALVRTSGIFSAYQSHRLTLRLAGTDVVDDAREPHDLLYLHFFGPRSLRLRRQARHRSTPVVAHAHSIIVRKGFVDFIDVVRGTLTA